MSSWSTNHIDQQFLSFAANFNKLFLSHIWFIQLTLVTRPFLRTETIPLQRLADMGACMSSQKHPEDRGRNARGLRAQKIEPARPFNPHPVASTPHVTRVPHLSQCGLGQYSLLAEAAPMCHALLSFFAVCLSLLRAEWGLAVGECGIQDPIQGPIVVSPPHPGVLYVDLVPQEQWPQ
eukprot:4440592-Amphidinium_carterae.2